jgi:hypothetical protein
LTELGFPENTNSVPSLDLKLSANELAIGKKTVDEIVPAKKTISILPMQQTTNATLHMVG